MLGGPGRTGCDGVRFSILRDWDDRDMSMADLCECVKECVSFVMWLFI
jgi:hypothetical protein